MGQRMLFVYNPRAGKAQIRSNLLDIIDIFVKAGYEVTAYPTQATGDAIKAVKERQGSYDMVACCGGDGTLDEVVNGMMQPLHNHLRKKREDMEIHHSKIPVPFQHL